MKQIHKQIIENTMFNYSNFIIYKIIPLIWLKLKIFLEYISKNKKAIDPRSYHFNSICLLVGKKKHQQFSGINLDDAAFLWAKYNLGVTDIEISRKAWKTQKNEIFVTLSWLKHKRGHHKFFINILVLAITFRIKRKKVFILLGDAFNLQWTLPACILVSICGGSIILQMNTTRQALNFGIILPIGPVIWTLNSKTYAYFDSNLTWPEREKSIIFSRSGDEIRNRIFNDNSHFLNLQGYKVKFSSHELDWTDYQNMVKSARIYVNTSLLQTSVRRRVGLASDLLPETTVTHRTWEGFCAGLVVVTNSNLILDSLGFEPGIHYLDLDELLKNNFHLPGDNLLAQISYTGNKLFMNLINYSIFKEFK